MPGYDSRESEDDFGDSKMSDSGRVIGDGRYAGPPEEEKFPYDHNDIPNSMYIRCVWCGKVRVRGDMDNVPCSDKRGHYFKLPDDEVKSAQERFQEKQRKAADMIKKMEAAQKRITDIEKASTALKTALRDFLKLYPELPQESIENTPSRWCKALSEMMSGYQSSPEEILGKIFEIECDEIIILRDIPFSSLCEHHLLLFSGTVDIGYIPGKVVGLSKLARLVDCFANRFQVQERMTKEIGDSIMKYLDAKGTAVVTKATHSCLSCRGVRKSGATMICSNTQGAFRTESAARAEFLQLCR